MDVTIALEKLFEDPSTLQSIIAPLPDSVVDVVVERLKTEAERQGEIIVERSLQLADMITQIAMK